MMFSIALHEQHAGTIDWDDFNHVVNKVFKDRLNREVAGQRSGEINQHRSQTLFVHNALPGYTRCARVWGIAACEDNRTPCWCETGLPVPQQPPEVSERPGPPHEPAHVRGPVPHSAVAPRCRAGTPPALSPPVLRCPGRNVSKG
jgi:hypothetical protein